MANIRHWGLVLICILYTAWQRVPAHIKYIWCRKNVFSFCVYVKRFQGFEILFFNIIHQQKVNCRYFCFVSVLKIIQIFFDLINLLIAFHRFFISVYMLTGCIVWNFFKNISKCVAKYKWKVPNGTFFAHNFFNLFISWSFFYISKICYLWKSTTGQGEDYTTEFLLDYEYIKNHYRLMTIDLSRQKELDADPEAIHQIEFLDN